MTRTLALVGLVPELGMIPTETLAAAASSWRGSSRSGRRLLAGREDVNLNILLQGHSVEGTG